MHRRARRAAALPVHPANSRPLQRASPPVRVMRKVISVGHDSGWQLGKRLTQYQEVRELRGRAPVVDPQAEHRLAQQAAGVAAEDQMTVALQRLSDDWLLFRGYVNRRGEVDHLVVGPGGIWAIEVKGVACASTSMETSGATRSSTDMAT